MKVSTNLEGLLAETDDMFKHANAIEGRRNRDQTQSGNVHANPKYKIQHINGRRKGDKPPCEISLLSLSPRKIKKVVMASIVIINNEKEPRGVREGRANKAIRFQQEAALRHGNQ